MSDRKWLDVQVTLWLPTCQKGAYGGEAGKGQCLDCAKLVGWLSEFDQVSKLEDQTDLKFAQYFISSTECFKAQKVIKLQADTGNA